MLPELAKILKGNTRGVGSRVLPTHAAGRASAAKLRVGTRPLPLGYRNFGKIDSGAGVDDEEDVAAQASMQDIVGAVGGLRKEVRKKSRSGSDKVIHNHK